MVNIKLFSKMKKDLFYKDLIITFAGQFIVMFLTFVINKIVSNQYSVEEYGIYNIIKRFCAVITYIMIMALGIAIPKYIAEADAKKDRLQVAKYYNSGMLIMTTATFVVSIFMIVFRKSISYIAFTNKGYDYYMIPMLLFATGSAVVTFASSYYRGKNVFVKYNIISIVMPAIQILILLLAQSNMYYIFIVWGLALILYGIYEIINIYIKEKFEFSRKYIDLRSIKTLLLYSVPRVPGEFVLFAYNLVPLTIISNKFNFNEVGYFSAALSINSLITPLFSLVGTILLPLVSKNVAQKKQQNIKQKINLLSAIYLVVSIAAVAFIYLFGEFVIIILYSREYVHALNLAKILIIAIIPNAFYLLLRNPLDGISRVPYNTIMLILSFSIYVVLLLFAPTVEYCAYATIIAYMLLGGGSFIVWKILSKKKLDKNI